MNAVIYAGGVLTLRIISHSNPGAITNLNIFGTRVAVGRFQRTTWETAGGATNRYEYRSGAINNPFPQGITRGTVSVTATSPITYWHAEGVAFTPADNSKLDAIPDQTAGNAGRFIGFDTRGQYAALPAPAGGGGNGGGLSETQVDGRVRALVSDWAEHDNAQVIPDAKFPASIARDSEVPSQAFIDGRVRAGTQSWARADPAPLIPDNRIPSSIARDSEIPTTADIDARVVAGTLDWAQTGNNNDIPEDKIPGEIARDSEIPTNAQIDARADARVAAGVEDWAEAGNTSVIPRNKVPEQGLSDAEEALLDIFIPNTPNQWQHPPVAGGVGLASAEWATKPNEATITAVNYNRAAFTTTVAPNGRWLGVYLIQGYNDNPSGYSLLVGSTRILGESWERIASGTVGSNTVTFYTAQVPADAGEASGVAVRVEELQYRVVHSAGGRSRLVIPGGATETGTFTQAAADARYQRKSEKLDDVENAFNTGGWADSGIAGVAVGSVGQLVLDPSPKDLSRVSGMMYSATPNDVSPRFTNRYIYFRLPASATGEEDKWRIRYGTTDNMVTNRIPASGSLDGVLYMGTVLGRRYYRRQINDLPVGWRIRVQELDPYELNTDYVNTDDIFPTPPAGALEYDLTSPERRSFLEAPPSRTPEPDSGDNRRSLPAQSRERLRLHAHQRGVESLGNGRSARRGCHRCGMELHQLQRRQLRLHRFDGERAGGRRDGSPERPHPSQRGRRGGGVRGGRRSRGREDTGTEPLLGDRQSGGASCLSRTRQYGGHEHILGPRRRRGRWLPYSDGLRPLHRELHRERHGRGG